MATSWRWSLSVGTTVAAGGAALAATWAAINAGSGQGGYGMPPCEALTSLVATAPVLCLPRPPSSSLQRLRKAEQGNTRTAFPSPGASRSSIPFCTCDEHGLYLLFVCCCYSSHEVCFLQLLL